jgi:lipopolysaccharide transport system permease protein
VQNAGLFGKVYFPRLAVPVSILISNLVTFAIQLALFILFMLFFMWTGARVFPNSWLFLLPFLILMMAGLGLGFGIIISSLTTKYRDLRFLVTFGVQLMMYATPVIYPVSSIPEKYRWLILANPMTPIVEAFRYAFLGAGTVDLGQLIYSFVFMVVLVIIGAIIFNRVEQTFMDTV